MKKRINYTFPIAVYNCDKKNVIGLFNSFTLAARYLFNDPIKARNLNSGLRLKCRVTTPIAKVAVRACNEEQRKELGDNDFIILNDYPMPVCGQMKGYTGLENFRNLPTYIRPKE